MTRVLALTLGDRYGIGPELVARAVRGLAPEAGLHVAVVGDRRVFDNGRSVVGDVGAVPTVTSFEEARTIAAPWAFLDRPFGAELLPLGRISAEAGRETLEILAFVVDAVRAGRVDGIVYAPLNKEAMRLAGHAAGDELDFIGHRFGIAEGTGEINILGKLWTSRVTSHVPLRAVAEMITAGRLHAAIALLDTELKRSGIEAPRIAVAALNPHAGEGGAFGHEEIDVITPAVAVARAAGHIAEGPYPSDTIFPRAIAEGIDGVVTLFHDQGQIALKLLGLGKSITLLAGLPVPIATPGHGTAYDIAGTGRARVDGFEAAIRLVSRMIQTG